MKKIEVETEIDIKEFIKMHTYAFTSYLFANYIFSLVLILVYGWLYTNERIAPKTFIIFLICIFMYKAITSSLDYSIRIVKDYIQEMSKRKAIERFMKKVKND